MPDAAPGNDLSRAMDCTEVVWSIYWNRVEYTRVYRLSMDSANFPRKELLMLPDFLRVVYGRVYPRTFKVLLKCEV